MLPTPKGLTTYSGIGQSLLFIPFDMLGYGVKKIVGDQWRFSSQIEVWVLLLFYLPTIALLWLYALYSFLKSLGEPPLSAKWGALLLSASTAILPYMAQSFQEEGIVSILALFLFCQLQKGNGFNAGLLTGLALVFRWNAVFAVSIPWIAVVARERSDRSNLFKSLCQILLGLSLPLGIIAYFNAVRFGSIFHTGYDILYEQLLRSGYPIWRAIQIPIVLGLLVGLGKGFFILSPPLLLSPFYKGPQRSLFWIASGVLLLSCLFHSKLNGFSCGGHSWGGRFQIDLIGFFSYPVWAVAKQKRFRQWSIALFSLGVLIQGAAMMAPESLEYLQEMQERGDYQEALITDFKSGQLPKRIETILFGSQQQSSAIDKIEQFHIPNFWGTSYGRYLPELAFQLHFLWMLCLTFGLGLLFWQLRPKMVL